MNLKEQVYSVLVVSAADAFNVSLQSLLTDAHFSPVTFESSVSAAKRRLLEHSFDFVLINAPLPDENGMRFSVDTITSRSTVTLLLVREELYSAAYDKVAGHGVYVLSKPTSKPVVSHALEWMITTRERLRRLEKKTTTIEEKMQEIRTVNRAKWLLIEQLKMTEAEAHRYIEKQAMDACVTKSEVAETIIKTYT